MVVGAWREKRILGGVRFVGCLQEVLLHAMLVRMPAELGEDMANVKVDVVITKQMRPKPRRL